MHCFLFLMDNTITEEKVERYFTVTEEALDLAKENIIIGREEDAREIVTMVENYISDAHHFEEKGDLVNAYGALNYSHGWIDAGVRLGVFNVNDDRLFTVK
jgi:hypothetical protein